MSKIVSMSSGAIDPIAQTKRVFYRPTAGETIRAGDCVCYDSDSVVDHKNRAADPTHLGLRLDTYTEGDKEFTGRLFVVERPKTANLHAFAGVVKSLGPKAGAAGDMIEIFVPNGAVVPVMVNADVVFNSTIVGISNDAYEAGDSGRPIGVARETVAGSGGDALCWIKLDPNMFLWQEYNNTALANIALTGGVINRIKTTFAATSGSACSLLVHTTASGDGNLNSFGVLSYLNLAGDYTGGYHRSILAQLNIDGTLTSAVHIAAIHAQLTGEPTITKGEHVQCIWADACLTGIDNGGDPSGDIEYSIIKMTNNGGLEDIIGQAFYVYGGYGIDKLFNFDTCLNEGAANEHFIFPHGTGGDAYVKNGTGAILKAKCVVDDVDYFIMLYSDPDEAT